MERSESRFPAALLFLDSLVPARGDQYRKINCMLSMLFMTIVRVESWYS